MYTRRSVLAAGAAAGVTATAGCLDFILGNDDLSFEATAASVSQATLQATGYEERGVEEQSMERTFEVGGESRTVGITNWRSMYDKAVAVSGGGGTPRAATFSVFTTPKAEVLGQTFNPVGDMSTAELLGIAQSSYGAMGNLQQVGEVTTQLVGKQTTVTTYETTAEVTDAGVEVPIRLHVSEAVSSGDDFLIALGGYPTPLSDVEQGNVFQLMGGIQHDG